MSAPSASPRFLISNDDSIAADGLAALEAAARELGDYLTVAPASPQSAMSHAVTMEAPLRLTQLAPERFSLTGTPADCARIGLLHVAPGAKWVLSGINHGGNLGADVHYSGTVAAVREAALHGWPGIAFSQYRKSEPQWDWPRASRWARRVLELLLPTPQETGVFFNVNFPHLHPSDPEPEVVFCALDNHPLPLNYVHRDTEGFRYDGNYHLRARTPGADVDRCFHGAITISRVTLFS